MFPVGCPPTALRPICNCFHFLHLSYHFPFFHLFFFVCWFVCWLVDNRNRSVLLEASLFFLLPDCKTNYNSPPISCQIKSFKILQNPSESFKILQNPKNIERIPLKFTRISIRIAKNPKNPLQMQIISKNNQKILKILKTVERILRKSQESP